MRTLIICAVLAGIFATSGCKHFGKKTMFKKGIDTLLENNREKDSIIRADSLKMVELRRLNQHLNLTIDSLKAMYESNRIYGDNKFFMIVGSFQNEKYANKWADKIGHMGYQTSIIPGRNGFNMVSAKGYRSFRQAVDDIPEFRNRVVDNAWVYVRN